MLRALVTALLVASALLAPAAGALPRQTTVTSTSTAGMSGSELNDMCQFLKDESNSASDAAYEAYHSGNKKRGQHFEAVADADFEEAHDLGCGWAA